MSSWAKAPTRFGKEPKEYTPGPGEYDAQAVSTTTKRGTGFGIGARMSINQTSEFAHLGPGAYATTGETPFCESNRRGTMLRSSAMDYSAAMKRLAASFAKVLGTPAGTQQRELSREDICTMAAKLVADSLAATSDAVRIKGELDGINLRVKDEVQAALKPSKATGNAGLPAAWKLYMPLEKAVEDKSGDLAKKLTKLTSLLSQLHDDFPALAVAMADGDRIGQLSQMVDTLETDLEEARNQAAESSAAAEAAKNANIALQNELATCKCQLMQQHVRAEKLGGLISSQNAILQSLEDQLATSHSQQEALLSQLLTAADHTPSDSSLDVDYQPLLDQCKESRDAHEQALHDLHDLQAQLTEMMAQNESDKASMEEQMLTAAEAACTEANEMLYEIDEFRAVITQSNRDKRILRSHVAALEAKRRALKLCLAAGAVQLTSLNTFLAESESHPHCQASPQRLCPEALEAVSQLDKSLTGDLMSAQLQVEVLTEANELATQELDDMQVQMTRMMAHSESDRALLEEQMLRAGDAACSQVNELMTELDELRAELLRTCSCLTQSNTERNASAARVEQLEGSLEELSQQRHAAELQHEAHLESKAHEMDALAQEAAAIAVEVESLRANSAAQLASLDANLKRMVEQKQKLERHLRETTMSLADTQQALAHTQQVLREEQQVMSQNKQAAENLISTLQDQLATRSQELADSQSEVAQLTELKAKLEGQIAALDGKLNTTEQELCETKDDLATRSQELVDSQSEVAQLTELKAQLDGQIAALDGKLNTTEQELCETKDDLATRSQELTESQSEVAQLYQLKVQYEQQMQAQYEAQLQQAGKLEMTEHALTSTQMAVEEVRERLSCTETILEQTREEASSLRTHLAEVSKQLEEVIADREQAEEWAARRLDEKEQLNLSLSQQVQDLSQDLEREHTLHLSDAAAAVEAAKSAASRLLSLEMAHKEVELAMNARLAKLHAAVAEMQTDEKEIKNMFQEMTVRVDVRTSEVTSMLEKSDAQLSVTSQQLYAARQQLTDSQSEVARLLQLDELSQQHNCQLQHQIAVLDGKLMSTEQQLCQTKSTEQELSLRLSKTQNDLATRSQQLADSQSEVAQLTELKAQLEGQIAFLVGNLASTEQELSKTQDDLRVARYSLTNSQSEVAQLTELTAQLEGQIASTEQELSKTQHELEELEASFEALEAASNQHKQALMQADVEKTRLMEHAAAVEAHLQEVEQRKAEITSDLQQAYADLQKSRSETQAASDAAEQQLAASNSKIEMLSCALKGTEKDKERALDAISNMYQDTDKRLKALSSGAAAMPLSDAGSLSRIATLQAELEASMMERMQCLEQLQELQQSEREAVAEAIKHRHSLEMLQTESKALSNRITTLEADNAKLSAENMQLVGHSNLKQKIHVFNTVKDENNALKKEKADAERLVAQQKKVIERLQLASGADKENACLFAKIDHEERLQAALKESENETRSLRKHLLTVVHHVQSSVGSTVLAEALNMVQPDVHKDILCDNNKSAKQRDWGTDVKEVERCVDALTKHMQQQQREVAGANLKIHLLEQSARILRPSSSSMVPTPTKSRMFTPTKA